MLRLFYSFRPLIVALAVLGIFGTDAKAGEQDLGNQLAPMPFPKGTPLGGVVLGVNQNGKTSTKVVKFDGRLKTWREKDGCEYVDDTKAGYFGPSLSWRNCGEGSTQLIKKTGNIWPLAVGKSETYKLKGKNEKGTWSETRKCKVRKQVRIKTHTGIHDTFKVVCSSQWAVRTYYMSPKLGRSVKNMRRKASAKSRVSRNDWELTKVVR